MDFPVPSVSPQPWRFTNNSLRLPNAHSLSVCLFLWACVVCGARGSEAQRAEAAARHQGRSTPGRQIIGGNYRGFICIFSGYWGLIWAMFFWFIDTGGLSNLLAYFVRYPGFIWFWFINTGGFSDSFSSIPGFYLWIPAVYLWDVQIFVWGSEEEVHAPARHTSTQLLCQEHPTSALSQINPHYDKKLDKPQVWCKK